MSADNGVYILKTKDGYRVTHAQGIENIYRYDSMERVYTGEPDPEMILDYFGHCQVFTDIVRAKTEAFHIEEDYLFLEYGVCMIDRWQDRTFEELVNGVKNTEKA